MVTRYRRIYLNFLYRGLYCISGNLNYFCSVWFIFYGCFADKLACFYSFLFSCHGATFVQSLLWVVSTPSTRRPSICFVSSVSALRLMTQQFKIGHYGNSACV